jgi:hypothetical protein
VPLRQQDVYRLSGAAPGVGLPEGQTPRLRAHAADRRTWVTWTWAANPERTRSPPPLPGVAGHRAGDMVGTRPASSARAPLRKGPRQVGPLPRSEVSEERRSGPYARLAHVTTPLGMASAPSERPASTTTSGGGARRDSSAPSGTGIGWVATPRNDESHGAHWGRAKSPVSKSWFPTRLPCLGLSQIGPRRHACLAT